mgnify:CR=1 FL=1
MKHSIKRQMTVVFSGLIIFILVMMFLVYSKCLETYYIMHKERDLLEVHKTVGTALAQGNKEDERAWKVMERTNISMLVLQDNQVIFSPRGDQEQLVSQLRGYVFNQNQDEGELLKSTDNYEIRKIRDPVAGIDYLEMWGTYSKGAIFILRSPLDSIWESTALANKLLVYVGIAALVLGGILVSLFARKITEPITELASLSRRMSELDFDARYTGGGEDEIGTLGNNFNIMSERLEKTVSELKRANNELMKDIEIPDGYAWISIGAIADGKSFRGTIEGNYHVISGLRPANDGTSFKWGLVAWIRHGSVQNIGLVLEGNWTCGLCRNAYAINIQNCFVVGTDFSDSCSDGTVTNCLAVSGKLEGNKYPNDNRATFTNCYETTKSDYSSPGITTLDNEEKLKKLKSGEIAYKLNGDRSDGTWGQVIGTEDYPHFRKYSKTVYYDQATQTYSNNKSASITSAAVTDIKTISDKKATATLKATGTPGAEVKFLLTSGEDEGTLEDMFSKGTSLMESSSGNYEYTIQNLAPDTEYHVRMMIKKDGKLSLDVTYVNFRTEKMRQEAPTAADVSINYEQETLENKASCELEYAASKDAQSWTTIRQGAKVRLTGLLDNIRENGGSVPFYIRKKASSSMSASEAVLVADLQRQAIPEESNKPNIDYREEEITISSSLQYVIVNGANTFPSWTSAKMGSESGISITDIISSDHESMISAY